MSDPLHTPTMLLKNSLNIKTPSDRIQGEKSRYLPRRLLQDSENDPPPSMISPSKFAIARHFGSSGRLRLPLEDHDANSQDSGISEDSKSCSEFRFAEPCGAAPRRMASTDMSPHHLLTSPLRSPSYRGTPDRSKNMGTPDNTSHRSSRFRIPDPSPKRSLSFSTDSAASLTSFTSEGTEDGFLDFFQNDKLLDEDAQLPGSGSRLGNLLSARILTGSTPPQSPHNTHSYHRSMSENISPNQNEVFSLKRPLLISSHSGDATTPVSKRHKPLSTNQESNVVPPNERGTLFQYGFKRTLAINNHGLPSPPQSITPPPHSPPRSPSSFIHHVATQLSPQTSSEHSIKLAFQRSTTEELIGDYTRPFALPLVSAKEHDLKTISCDTLASLLKEEYSKSVSSFRIIDCRYPYEYEGGHIKGAVNLYRRDQISHELQSRKRDNSAKRSVKFSRDSLEDMSPCAAASPPPVDEICQKNCFTLEKDSSDCDDSETDINKRHILVFHCEYSAERGPSLFRWLRQEDRAGNPYPQLTFPELYLLDGGYKAFFNAHPDLCEPQSYKPMTHPEHTQDLKHFRARSKSWAGKHHKKLSVRNLSRLGF